MVRVVAAAALGSVAGGEGGGGGVSREAGTSICSNLIRSSSSRFFLASAQPMRAQARVARNGVMCCVARGRNAAASTGRSAITRAKPKAAPARCIVAEPKVAARRAGAGTQGGTAAAPKDKKRVRAWGRPSCFVTRKRNAVGPYAKGNF